MQNRLLELKDTLTEFVDQSDHFALCLDVRDDDLLYVHKLLLAVDREQVADIVLGFAAPFESASDWVDGAIANLKQQIEATNSLIAADPEAAVPRLTALPSTATDSRLHPAARLRAAMDHVAGCLPSGDHRVVWGMLPVTIANPHEYTALLGQLLPVSGLAAWMRPHRIIFRDDRRRPFMQAALATAAISHVLVYFIDLSPEAFSSDLVEQVSDPSTPEDQRMVALLQLAGHDFAHGRSAEAIDKYGVLYAHYEKSENPAMQALCLGGVAEVLVREGEIAGALQRYQQGLALAVPAENLPVMLNLLLGAGACSARLGRWPDAEGYYGLANQAAGKTFNPFCKCDCLEQIGVARLAQARAAEAIEAWNAALNLSARVGYHPRRRSVLERMTAVYRDAGMATETRACETALAEARQLEQGWTTGAPS